MRQVPLDLLGNILNEVQHEIGTPPHGGLMLMYRWLRSQTPATLEDKGNESKRVEAWRTR